MHQDNLCRRAILSSRDLYYTMAVLSMGKHSDMARDQEVVHQGYLLQAVRSRPGLTTTPLDENHVGKAPTLEC